MYMPPYALVWTERFQADLDRIASYLGGESEGDGHKWFDRAAESLYEELQSNPHTNSHALSSGRRYIRTKHHLGSVPPLYVVFAITKDSPDGRIELRRIVAEAEIRDHLLWGAILEDL